MLESIEIRNFKRIADEKLVDVGAGFIPPDENYEQRDGVWYKKKPLILNNLTNVNYLVGENGSGKSSVLESLAISNLIKNRGFSLNTYKGVSRKNKSGLYLSLYYNYPNQAINIEKLKKGSRLSLTYFQNEKPTKVYFHKKKGWFYKTYNKNESYIKSKSVLFSNSNLYDSDIKLHGELNETYHYNNLYWFHNFENEDFDYNEYLEEHGHPKGVKISDLNHNIVNYLREIDGLNNQVSDGIHFLKNLVLELHYYALYDFNQILVDEPENSIHPKIQKMLPELFKSLSTTYPNIQFLISTHSPFIISAAADFRDSQKVYLIKDGQTVDLEENNNETANSGFSGGEAILAVNKMLGSGLNDLFGKNMVFCEKSLSEFVQNFIDHNKLNANLTFITSGGDNAIINESEIFNKIIKNFNNFNNGKIKYNLNTYAIFDKNKQLENKDNQRKIQNLSDSGCKVIVLPAEEIEQLYPRELVNTYLKSVGLPEWSYSQPKFKDFIKTNSNDIKLDLAKYVGKQITTEQFKTNFTELHKSIFK